VSVVVVVMAVARKGVLVDYTSGALVDDPNMSYYQLCENF
jgi:hypothetical protein